VVIDANATIPGYKPSRDSCTFRVIRTRRQDG
jgi:hypothetical protein